MTSNQKQTTRKKSNSQSNFNAIPPSLFSLKTSKFFSTLFIMLSTIFSMILFILVICGQITFTDIQLKESAEFTLNLVFIVSAWGLAIFTLPIKSDQPQKENIILRYIGSTLVIASLSIFAYILSYCSFMNIKIFNSFDIYSIYFCAMLVFTSFCLVNIFSTIIAFFNIKE